MSLGWRIFRMDMRKSELDEEMEAHRRMAMEDHMARGEQEDDARAAVEREMGNGPLTKDVTRDAWGWTWVERLLQDVRYALRQMKRSPGFAATVIGTLALGIGAATAMFTVVDHVLLRTLPYRNPKQLVILSNTEKIRASAVKHHGLTFRSGGRRAIPSKTSGFRRE